VKTIAAQVPRHLRAHFLSRLAELLPPEFGDADVWRCAHKAVQVLTAKVIWRRQSARAFVDATIVRICAMPRLRSWTLQEPDNSRA
jgi:hypothetical protein